MIFLSTVAETQTKKMNDVQAVRMKCRDSGLLAALNTERVVIMQYIIKTANKLVFLMLRFFLCRSKRHIHKANVIMHHAICRIVSGGSTASGLDMVPHKIIPIAKM